MRIITKAAFTHSADNLRTSAFLFFALTVLICIAALFVQRQIMSSHPLCLSLSQDTTQQPFLENDESEREDPPVLPDRSTVKSWLAAASDIKVACVCIALNAVFTLAIFPGILSDVEVVTVR